MKKIIGAVVAIAIAVGAYFGLTMAGIIGAPAVLSAEEVEAGLATYAEQINSDEGVRFDDFSRLTSAIAIEKTITIRGEALLDMEQISDGYHDSRIAQGHNALCTDETLRELMRGRATVNFNWFSADGESIGDMITVRGDEVCAAFE